MTRAKSRTIRDALEYLYLTHNRNPIGYKGKCEKEVDQALQEIETMILESLPEKKEIEYETIRTHTGEVLGPMTDDIGGQFYNQAIDDYEANLLKILQ